MQVQMSLKGNPVEGKEKKPWTGICCEACYNAEYKRCTCRCGGAHHGEGRGKGPQGSKLKVDLSDFSSDLAAQIYERLIKRWECVECHNDLHGEPILHYDHDCGFPVEGFQKKQWLFITCPICGYQNSLLKLGVPADAEYATAQNAQPIEAKFVKEENEDK